MTQLIKNRQRVDDQWLMLPSDVDPRQLPEGDIIVTAPVWQAHRETLLARNNGLGITLSGDDDLDAIVPDLDRFQVIALKFPTFRDGRAYSMARHLREHAGYQGEIRAVGDVLRDQLAYMERVGFNAFVIDPRQSSEDALNAFDEISVKYQASSDEPLPIYRRRAMGN